MRRIFLVLSAALMIFILSAMPAVSKTEDAMGCRELEMYMAHRSTAKADIVFVFDTTSSMGGEIREMRNVCKIFVDGLAAMGIDYRLGLTAFRDFPVTCGVDENKICGKYYDDPYDVHNDGILTDNYLTFKSWLDQLSAGGGGDIPEAILAALRHTVNDIQWREGDVEKVIVLITDAPPHPDDDCCNIEGDTWDGVISALTSNGIKVYTIGPGNNSLEQISFDTGGKFYEIRSQLIRPVLEEVTAQIVLTFNIATEITPLHNRLNIEVGLLGKENEEIPYVEGLTKAWTYLKYENGTSRKYELTYDSTSESYIAVIEPVSGFVELTLYGKVCDTTTVETVKIDCRADNQPPKLIDLNPDYVSPQEYDTAITFTANATDSEGDTIYYSFCLKGPSTDSIWQDQTGWMKSNLWTWNTDILDMGPNQIRVNIRDIFHTDRNSWDDQILMNYTIIGRPPVLNSLVPDKPSPQGAGTTIFWTANATDPEKDTLYYRFWLKGPSTEETWQDQTGWTTINLWNWSIDASDIGITDVRVQVRDRGHAGPESYDDQMETNYTVINKPPVLTSLESDKSSPQITGTAITWTAIATDPEKDTLYYRFWLKGPSTKETWQDQTGWTTSNLWTWSTDTYDIGEAQVRVQARDAYHAGPEGYDDQRMINYTIINQPPVLTDLTSDKPRPQKVGAAITWTASAIDPEGDTVHYKFLMKGPSTGDRWKDKSGWSENNSLTWSTTDSDIGATMFEIQIRDGNHAGPDGWDDHIITKDYTITRWEPTWVSTLGGSEMDGSYSVQETSNNGYIIAGSTYSYGPGGDFWLIRTDPEGNEIWNRTLGGSFYERSISLQQTKDGGYIITGGTFSYGSGAMDVWLVKTDPQGNENWNRTFGGSDGDFGVCVQQTRDRGYIIAGMTESFSAGDEDAWLIKTDSLGNKKWDKTFGGPSRDEGESVMQTSDEGYIIAGVTESFGAGGADAWLIKTDPKGNLEWDKTFGGNDDDMSWQVQETEDGSFIIAGWTASHGAGGKDVWLIKTDSEGNCEWDRTFGGPADDRGSSIQRTSDGGYIIAGGTFSYGAGDEDVWLIKTDSRGNMQWNRTFGEYGFDVSWSVQETSDGGYIIAGWTTSFGTDENDEDVFLIKTDSAGGVRDGK